MLIGFNQVIIHPTDLWIQPSHRPPQCSLESTKSPATPMLLRINQVTGHPSAPWNQPSHRPPQCSLESSKSPTTLVLLGFNQVTGHPSALWNQPSHQSTSVFPWTIQATGPTPMFLWTHPNPRSTPVLPWTHPSHRSTPIGVDLVHCTRLQWSLHFWAYTLAMHYMVSTFIQHPSTYPSRYIIEMVW
jgi:hypothetical protein